MDAEVLLTVMKKCRCRREQVQIAYYEGLTVAGKALPSCILLNSLDLNCDMQACYQEWQQAKGCLIVLRCTGACDCSAYKKLIVWQTGLAVRDQLLAGSL